MAKMTDKEKEGITKIAEGCRMLGWSMTTKAVGEEDKVNGVIIGTVEFIKEVTRKKDEK